MDALIEQGSRISFPRGKMMRENVGWTNSAPIYDGMETSFQDDTQMGTKRAYRVKVL